MSLREDTYELYYNAACLHIGREQYDEALEKLQRAEGLFVDGLAHSPESLVIHVPHSIHVS